MTKGHSLHVVDSSGWLEFAADGPLADRYFDYIEQTDRMIIPSIVVCEVYKCLKRDASETLADGILVHMGKTKTIPLDDRLAVQAAEISLAHNLAMADAIVYATARMYKAALITSDADFKGLPDVVYLKKS